MKSIIFLFFVLIFPCLNVAANDFTVSKDVVSNELVMLDDLISATQQNLEIQLKLRELLQSYQQIQEQYLQKPDDNELLFQMVKHAHIIFEMIKENHLTQAFDPAFLGELTLVSKPVSKLGIPKP